MKSHIVLALFLVIIGQCYGYDVRIYLRRVNYRLLPDDKESVQLDLPEKQCLATCAFLVDDFKSADVRDNHKNCVCSSESFDSEEDLTENKGWHAITEVAERKNAELYRTHDGRHLTPAEDLDYAILIVGPKHYENYDMKNEVDSVEECINFGKRNHYRNVIVIGKSFPKYCEAFRQYEADSEESESSESSESESESSESEEKQERNKGVTSSVKVFMRKHNVRFPGKNHERTELTLPAKTCILTCEEMLSGFKSADHKMDDSDCICSTAQPHFDDDSLEEAEGWEILSEIRDIEHAQLYNVPEVRQIMSNNAYDYAILIVNQINYDEVVERKNVDSLEDCLAFGERKGMQNILLIGEKFPKTCEGYRNQE